MGIWSKKGEIKINQFEHESGNIGVFLAIYAVPRLKEFRRTLVSHPTSLSMTEWQDIVDKMILGLSHYEVEDRLLTLRECEERKEAGELLGKWLNDLWN